MIGFDTGGSHKSQQTGFESFGVRNQNGVVTDGVDTTEGTGGAGFYQDFFAQWTRADDRNKRHALFVQDRWSRTSRLTVTLGVRWDRQQPHYEASIRQSALSAIFPAQTVPAATLLTSDRVVPRLGLSYDLVGDGKSVIKAFFGRYYTTSRTGSPG